MKCIFLNYYVALKLLNNHADFALSWVYPKVFHLKHYAPQHIVTSAISSSALLDFFNIRSLLEIFLIVVNKIWFIQAILLKLLYHPQIIYVEQSSKILSWAILNHIFSRSCPGFKMSSVICVTVNPYNYYRSFDIVRNNHLQGPKYLLCIPQY